MKSNFFLASFCAAFVGGAPSGLEPNSCGKPCLTELGTSCDPSILWAAKSCISSSKCAGSEKTKLLESIMYSCGQEKAHITGAPKQTPTEHLELKRAWGPFSGNDPWSGGGPWGSSWTGTGPWPTTGPYSNWGPGSGNGPFGGDWGPGGNSWTGTGPWPTTGPYSNWGPGGSSWTGTGPWPTTGPYSNWGPGSGNGPFRGNSGPWGSSTGAWTSSPWTSWWEEKGCPDGSWSGWSSGQWSTNAPWISWTKGCTATTTASTTFTTTSGGSSITGTSFGIKVAEATSDSTPLVTGTGTTAIAASSTIKSGASPAFSDCKPWILLLSLVVTVFAGLL